MAVTPQTANDLMVVFSGAVSSGFAALQGPVNGVFGLMITLVVALTGLQWAMSPHREIFAGAFGKILLIGSFAYLINDWQGLSETLQAGFIDLGLAAGGGGLSRADFLNPGAVLQQGWDIVKALGETPMEADNPLDVAGAMTDALVLGLAMIGILLGFAILALQIIVTLLEFKIVTLCGFVLLPFGVWSKSAFLAERPLGFVVSSGLKALALAVVVSGARSIFDQLQPSASPDLYEALAILAASLLLAMLAIFIPSLAAALVNGGPALGAGAAATGALAVGGLGLAAAAGATGLGAGAARILGASRSAAGAESGGTSAARPPPPSPRAPPPSGASPLNGGPRPSNDNPASAPSRGGSPAPGMSEPASAWTAAPAAVSAPAMGEALVTAGATPSHPGGGPDARRPTAQIAAEAQAAQGAFHRAANARPAGTSTRADRSLAARAFFAANTGRSFLPSGEASGSLSPRLKTEDS